MVATDGSATYVMYLYGEIEETRAPAIGFNAGDTERGYNLPKSAYGGSPTNLSASSNVGRPGTFVFRVDQNDIQGRTIIIVINTYNFLVYTGP